MAWLTGLICDGWQRVCFYDWHNNLNQFKDKNFPESLRAYLKNIPGGLVAHARVKGRPAGVVAPQLQIFLEYAPSSRLAIQPAALAIPSPAFFSDTLLATSLRF
jgi:acetyl-CoA carboxylase carboxyltransferase component